MMNLPNGKLYVYRKLSDGAENKRIKHVRKIKKFYIENKYGHMAVWPHKLFCLEW